MPIIKDSFEKHESTNSFVSPSKNTLKRIRIDDSVQTEKCRFCNKDFKSILQHLNRSKTCQSVYNMEEFDEIKKKKQKEKVAKFRLKQSDSEKKLDKLADAKNKA